MTKTWLYEIDVFLLRACFNYIWSPIQIQIPPISIPTDCARTLNFDDSWHSKIFSMASQILPLGTLFNDPKKNVVLTVQKNLLTDASALRSG